MTTWIAQILKLFSPLNNMNGSALQGAQKIAILLLAAFSSKRDIRHTQKLFSPVTNVNHRSLRGAPEKN